MHAKRSQLPTPKGKARVFMAAAFLVVFCGTILTSCSGSGACVGSGGNVLTAAVCKADWTRSECHEWDDMKVNYAAWTYHGGASCEGLGYTERCSDGSYRLPGDC
jgi:hypothetical protein